jgi:hypothetical protein
MPGPVISRRSRRRSKPARHRAIPSCLAYGATYTEHVDIADRSLTIKSGPSCLLGGTTPSAPAESGPSVSVSGPGNDNVFAISGNSHITLIDLDILNGKRVPATVARFPSID